MQFNFGDKGEVYHLDESALPVTEKERRQEGKRNISPWINYGHANLKSFSHVSIGMWVKTKHKYTTYKLALQLRDSGEIIFLLNLSERR